MAHAVRHILPLLILLSGCGFTGEGAFPSLKPRPGELPRELPRELAAPDAGSPPSLSPEERTGLAADLARHEQALAKARQDIRAAGEALAPAIRAASGSPIGSEAWSVAQLQLSRFDQARAPLGEMSSRMGDLRLMVDSLAEADPDRLRVQALARDLESLQQSSAATAAAATKALSRS